MDALILVSEASIGVGGEIAPRLLALGAAVKACGFTPAIGIVGNAEGLKRLLAEYRNAVPLVWNTIHDTLGTSQPGHRILEYLERNRIPYVGSNAASQDLFLSKAALKQFWRTNGVGTPDYYVVRSETEAELLAKALSPEGYPVIVKPSGEGNSRGISEASVMMRARELLPFLKSMLPDYQEILVEKYLGSLTGMREFTVAMIGKAKQCLYMPSELILTRDHQQRVITTKDKENSHAVAIPLRDGDLREKTIAFAKTAFAGTGARDYARCDIIYAEGRFFALEINGLPMVPDPWFTVCGMGGGMNEQQTVASILLAACRRMQAEYPSLSESIPQLESILPQALSRFLAAGDALVSRPLS